MGNYYGEYGFDMMTHAKSMLISPRDVAGDRFFHLDTAKKNAELEMWLE